MNGPILTIFPLKLDRVNSLRVVESRCRRVRSWLRSVAPSAIVSTEFTVPLNAELNERKKSVECFARGPS
jgi:hypothetical protein